MVEVSHEDVTYILGSVQCYGVVKSGRNRVWPSSAWASLVWTTVKWTSDGAQDLESFSLELQDNRQLLVDRSGRLSVRASCSVLGFRRTEFLMSLKISWKEIRCFKFFGNLVPDVLRMSLMNRVLLRNIEVFVRYNIKNLERYLIYWLICYSYTLNRLSREQLLLKSNEHQFCKLITWSCYFYKSEVLHVSRNPEIF